MARKGVGKLLTSFEEYVEAVIQEFENTQGDPTPKKQDP